MNGPYSSGSLLCTNIPHPVLRKLSSEPTKQPPDFIFHLLSHTMPPCVPASAPPDCSVPRRSDRGRSRSGTPGSADIQSPPAGGHPYNPSCRWFRDGTGSDGWESRKGAWSSPPHPAAESPRYSGWPEPPYYFAFAPASWRCGYRKLLWGWRGIHEAPQILQRHFLLKSACG